MANPPEQQDKLSRNPDGSPDWGAIELDVLCARCDYNLRTLTVPRCPECGMEFSWDNVLDRAEHHNEFLFEHAWMRRPIRSWIETWWRCLRPSRFWRRVSIHERVNVGPLFAFLVSSVIVAVVFFVVSSQAVAALLAVFIKWAQNSPNIPLTYMVRTHYQLDRLAAHPHWPVSHWLASLDYRFWLVPVGLALCVIGLFAVLSVLQQTLERYRVRRVQLVRIVAYASPPMMVWSCAILIVFACTLPFSTFGGPIPFIPSVGFHGRLPPSISRAGIMADLGPFEVLAYLGLIISGYGCVAYHIAVPVRDYLRVSRPWRLALVGALVTCLVPISIVAILSLTITGSW